MTSNNVSSAPMFGNGAVDNRYGSLDVFDNFLFEGGAQAVGGNKNGKNNELFDGKFDDDSINDQFDDDGKKRKRYVNNIKFC